MSKITLPFGGDDLFGEETVETGLVDLVAIVKGAVARVRDELRAKTPIEMVLRPTPDLHGPSTNLFQVLVNVLLNAEDVAARSGVADARVVLEARPGQEGATVIEVRAHRGAVSHAPAKPDPKNYLVAARTAVRWEGFGLDTCEKMLSRLRGSIALEDHPDGTMRFRIVIPQTQAAAIKAPAPAPESASGPKRRTTREFVAVNYSKDKK